MLVALLDAISINCILCGFLEFGPNDVRESLLQLKLFRLRQGDGASATLAPAGFGLLE